jgi:hypothetical protein
MEKPPEYFDIQEVAQFYSDLLHGLEYPKIIAKPKREDFKNNESYGKAMDMYELLDRQERTERIREYNKTQREIEVEFKAELLKRLELEGNPKADKLYSMAWDRGHSSGLSEVASIAENLAELIR